PVKQANQGTVAPQIATKPQVIPTKQDAKNKVGSKPSQQQVSRPDQGGNIPDVPHAIYDWYWSMEKNIDTTSGIVLASDATSGVITTGLDSVASVVIDGNPAQIRFSSDQSVQQGIATGSPPISTVVYRKGSAMLVCSDNQGHGSQDPSVLAMGFLTEDSPLLPNGLHATPIEHAADLLRSDEAEVNFDMLTGCNQIENLPYAIAIHTLKKDGLYEYDQPANTQRLILTTEELEKALQGQEVFKAYTDAKGAPIAVTYTAQAYHVGGAHLGRRAILLHVSDPNNPSEAGWMRPLMTDDKP
ncbi:hypothetical protein, partial [Burkholderia orbicola]|uniref:hypothetical protein n=1 Tax=Burkholderia orbicola TaxID=2978683 RepID=UPI002FE26A2C